MRYARFAGTFFPLLTVLMAVGGYVCPVASKVIPVSSADDIETAMETAQPGDTLVMADGTWTDQEVQFAGNGTADSPITLRAQTPGGVVLTGTSQLLISGDHLVVDGLHFKDGTLDNSDKVVQFRGSLGEATNSRFTNSVIESYNPVDLNDKYLYVSLYGQNNRVDHNRFLDQKGIGVQIVVWLDESSAAKPANHRIDSNHFGDRPRGWGNGFETIRLGDSDTSRVNAGCIVENNLFERVDGEIEIISSKSNDNVFRNNTFRDCRGTLTLRHGNNNIVEGNFFLGGGVEDSGGIRVIGEGHTIVNNYIADVDDEADGAISFAAGIPGSQLNGYFQVKNVLIAHNTIVNVKGAAITLDWGFGTRSRSLLPDQVTFDGNVIYSANGPLIEGQEGSSFTFTYNIAFGAELGLDARPGIREVDPLLVQDADGIWRPGSGSPALEGAEARSDAQDVRKPLNSGDVGAAWHNYTPPSEWGGPPPLPPGAFLVVEAEAASSITDPDSDGDVWAVAEVAQASGGKVIKAPDGGRTDVPADPHETLALYNITFTEAGEYTVYYLARGFDGSSDSFYTADGFALDPANTENVSSDGVFRWEGGGEVTIDPSRVGKPQEFRVGRREGMTEIDVIIFYQGGSLTQTQLEAIHQSTTANE